MPHLVEGITWDQLIMADGDIPEDQFAEWRAHLQRHQAVHGTDVKELEGHLRGQVAALEDVGLTADEALLISIRRMGNLDGVSREFARVNSEWLRKQLVADPDAVRARGRTTGTDTLVVIGLALVAALAIKVPELFDYKLTEDSGGFYARNLGFFVLPLLTGYFVWKNGMDVVRSLGLILTFAAAAVLANAFPFMSYSATEVLTAIHLPIALWGAVGIAYAGDRWNSIGGRMDFVRFSGELFIYYVLIILGGGLLIVFTETMFNAIGQESWRLTQNWLVPCGGIAAIIVSAWLVERKQDVIENMAPVLTRLFTPLFTVVLLAFLGTMVWTGQGIDMERNVLIGFDLLLVLVLILLLYTISARDPQAPPNASDALQLLLVAAAIVVDIVALAGIAARISEFGFSPNKVAALGENIVMFVNLVWSAWLYAGFLRGNHAFAALERWQTAYLPVYVVWAALVVIVFPPLFGYA